MIDPESPESPESLADLATTEVRRLPGHYATITMEDGTTLEVKITNREYIAWDKATARHKWGSVRDAPFLSASYMAWHAARRTGALSMSFDAFASACEDVESKDTTEDDDGAGPTPPGARPGS